VGKSWLSINSLVLMLLVCFHGGGTVYAEDYRAWTGDFMRMGAGARAYGMGNAYTAVEGDIYSSYFNPAGLAAIKNRQLVVSLRDLGMDRLFRYAALGGAVGPDAGFALSWLSAGTEDIVGRDLNGNPTETLRDTRNSFTLSFAKIITDYVSVGLNTKLTFWKLGEDDARAFGFDGGVIVRPLPFLKASFVIRDINSRFTWQSNRWKTTIAGADGQSIEKEDKFPAYFTTGLSCSVFDDTLILAGTLESVEDNPTALNLGVSYQVHPALILRGGVYNYTSDAEINEDTLTGGLTLVVTQTLSLDYAYVADTLDNGGTHIFSFAWQYGENE